MTFCVPLNSLYMANVISVTVLFFSAGSACKETEDQHFMQKLQELYQKLDSIAKSNLFRQKRSHARLQFCHTMVLLFCVWL